MAMHNIAMFPAYDYTLRMTEHNTHNAPGVPALRVIVSLDVEEEGLFSGRYASTGCGVRNVALLRHLAPLTLELGFPLTLFCAYTVFTNTEACGHLAWMRDHCKAEIAAHLHHWSTPPLDAVDDGPPLRTDQLPRDLLRQRLHTLFAAGRQFQSAPITSFRMGRWDLKSAIRPLLAEEGVTLDSSVCPLRVFRNGPDHFLAPTDPYWPADTPGLLESPITQIPLSHTLAHVWHMLTGRNMADAFHFWGALSANPVWHAAPVMRAAAWLHKTRGGKVLHLFLHSSELMPGASPNVPDQRAADALYHKLYAFLAWLGETFVVQGITASQLRMQAPALGFSQHPHGTGDW